MPLHVNTAEMSLRIFHYADLGLLHINLNKYLGGCFQSSVELRRNRLRFKKVKLQIGYTKGPLVQPGRTSPLHRLQSRSAARSKPFKQWLSGVFRTPKEWAADDRLENREVFCESRKLGRVFDKSERLGLS